MPPEWKRALLALGLIALLGCGHPQVPQPEVTDLGSPIVPPQFDPATAGSVHGTVVWNGEIRSVPDFESRPNPLGGPVLQKKHVVPNPNRPIIDPATRVVAGAVVHLRGVDPKHAKMWYLPRALVEQRDLTIHIKQGSVTSNVGFVRRGDSIEIVSRDAHLHALHAEGAAFFTLSFPDPDQPLHRQLKEAGLVELTSAAGYFWMRGYLFVDEHPYYTRTDERGNFELKDIPAGSYELVCWMPNWNEAKHERDPESATIARIHFRPPVEMHKTVRIEKATNQRVEFSISSADFAGQ
jgi:hypothetical protein